MVVIRVPSSASSSRTNTPNFKHNNRERDSLMLVIRRCVCSKLAIGFNVWRKGTGTLFPDRSRHPRWLPPITGRSNPNQATAAGSRPRKSFLFCLTHEVIPGSSSAGDRVSRCGRAPRLSCASWCFCWSVKTWSRGSSNGLVVKNVDSVFLPVVETDGASAKTPDKFGTDRTLYPHPVSKVRSLCSPRHM